MNRSLRGEHGTVLAFTAIIIPVFLLLAALVLDVGDWYTHKRQLQTRADAGAFAAGVEYAKNWKACVQNGDPTLKANTAREIANAARQYAADPDAADYAPDTPPASLYNADIANQNKLDVIINSDNFTDDNDYSDGDASTSSNGGIVADPCFNHPANPNDDTTPQGGQWTDVKVKERDLPSIFGSIGLPLSKNTARARIEIRPALSGHRFLPLAVPNNVITKVQVRYYNECTSPATLIATRDLAPLPAADQTAFAAAGGGTLWGLPSGADPTVGDPNLSFGLALPSYTPSCGDYLPIGMEVRLASTDIDLNQSCATLIAARFADCFHRLSQIRVYNDGNADSQPRVTNVRLTGGCGAPADAYFSTLPVAANNCRYDVSAEVDWGTRDDPPNNVAGNFTVSANGTTLANVSWNTPNGTAIYASSGGAIVASPGANTVSISLNWEDHNPTHSWGGQQCRNGNNTPCKYSGSQAAHRAFVGTTGTAGAVALARSGGPWNTVANLPGQPFDNIATGGTTVQIFPTVGTRSVLTTGTYVTLRLDDPQANQTLQCDPNYAQGQEFSAFRYGCQPWYTTNKWTAPWWNTTTKQCPPGGQWFSYSDLGAGFGVNSSTNPWQCVLTAPGMSTGQVGDDIAVATQNCNNILNNGCQTNSFACNYDGNYDGKNGNPGWVQQGGDSRYPRVVNLFIVPYQGSKGLTGAGDTIPILGFASFYVMDWGGSNNQQSDPCPDTTWGNITMPRAPAGAITGTFVETVDFEPGPVDPNAVCYEGMLGKCRAVLTR